MAIAYRKGDLVEVSSNDEGFLSSYFATKVLAAGRTLVLVEYETLLTPDESGLLKEIAKYSQVRPRPPEILVSAFRVFEKVDAYDNEGWWVGRITSLRTSLRSLLFFFHTGNQPFLKPVFGGVSLESLLSFSVCSAVHRPPSFTDYWLFVLVGGSI
ncbi:protein AGENET DOMAIN (AGD)-CONTAINING P1-like [Telopea speciosissima]|uniref:protein AGENET DOMAIN (AGD)-CONTAINING P1-like n=1 Tax=Telopea speciosissima TaxID=54955 RepID=UPI001CC66A80|nr:protein AGENET DOMAIN (AGD)-CONTAINING P1-like [Telopea speciosissima]